MEKIYVPWEGWEAVREIGRGSYGKVYEIRRNAFGFEESSAMKVLHVPQNEGDIDLLRFEGMDDDSIYKTYHGYVSDMVKEYQLMLAFKNNTNIVHVEDYKVIRDDNKLVWRVYIKMELLTPILKAPQCIETEEQILKFAKDLCKAIIACHKKNILHRDIKPQNIFFDPGDGNFKLGDFGVSRIIEQTTIATVGVGAYSYMAPEVLKGQPYGVQADIYSLGMTLYWALNDHCGPFVPLLPQYRTPDRLEEAKRRRFQGEPIPAPLNGSNELKRIVLKACAYEGKHRFLTAQNMLDALNAIDSGGQESRKDEGEETIIDREKKTRKKDSGGSGSEGSRHVKFDDQQNQTINNGSKESHQRDKQRDDFHNDKKKDENGDISTGKVLLKSLLAGVIGVTAVAVFILILLLAVGMIPSESDNESYETQPSSVIETVSETVNKTAPLADEVKETTSIEDWSEDDESLKHMLVESWATGSVKMSIFSSNHVQIEFAEQLLLDGLEEGEAVCLQLNHDLARGSNYNIYFRKQDGKLTGNAMYTKNGALDYSNTPTEFTWEQNGATVLFDLVSDEYGELTMYDFEGLHVYQIFNGGSPEMIHSIELEESAASVQFQYFEGPDETEGGIITEKAIIVGLDKDGEPLWTHLSSVKYEPMAQSARLRKIGYINGRYFYQDEDKLVVLDGATGELVKNVFGFESPCTDYFVNPDGTMYFCCHNGPYFIELSEDLEVIKKIEDLGYTYDWARDIYREGDSVYVACQLGPNQGKQEDYVFKISLNDYSSRLTNPD